MATPEFISVLRKIRDVIYPQINELYNNSFALKKSIDIEKAEFNADLIQFNTDYSDFNTKKTQIDASVLSANNSELSASQSAQTATNKSNEIKAITAQSTTGAPGTSASASYNPTDGKFTFNIPQGLKGDKGESFTVNSSGATEQRALYDEQPVGWSFLDVTTSLLYFKTNNASGNWSNGVPFGKGDKGDIGDTGVGIVSFTFISTTDVSGLPAQSGATDTYRVTLADTNAFDYKIYNGLDYSNELLDTKLDKNFSNFDEKTTPADTDILAIQEVGGLFKKLRWDNLKATLKTYFDTLYFALTGDQTVGGIKTFTSSPIVPTPSYSDNSTKVATTEFVRQNINNATANLAVGDIGTYSLLFCTTVGKSIIAGSTYSGSLLKHNGYQSTSSAGGSVAAVTVPGYTVTGTWRAMGNATVTSGGYANTLFLRIS